VPEITGDVGLVSLAKPFPSALNTELPKLVPVIVTWVPPVLGPEDGLTPVTVGALPEADAGPAVKAAVTGTTMRLDPAAREALSRRVLHGRCGRWGDEDVRDGTGIWLIKRSP
jgi:hypothetical protein